jgi:hypothetical protein
MVLLTAALAIVFAIGWHAMLPKSYWAAVLASCLTVTLAVQMIAAGHATPSDTVAVAVFALAISATVGFLIRQVRERGK